MDFVFVCAQVERKRMLKMAAAQGAYTGGTEELVLVKHMAQDSFDLLFVAN